MLSSDYMTLLQKSGLMSTAQLSVALALSLEREAADALGDELVRQGLLTSWQATQLLKGQTGFVLQHYKLLEAIGKGGMGHVFKAIDSRDSSIVAVKVMSRKLSSNQNLVNRFRREIRASSRLNCPWVVRTIDAGRVGKIDFMVMEFVNGDQLDNILQKVSTLPASIACEIARQAALGLQHAHEQKMVHRDIKPANLMIDWTSDNTGVVKIMDMGLVRLSEEDEERTAVTRAGQVMGTPDYMSPEQGWNTATVDIRSDIYSLGCTLFRLLTGKVPFPGENPLQVLMARCSRDVPPASSLRPELAEPIDLLLQKMTRRDPQERFQTPADVADALQPWCAPLTVAGLNKLAASQPGAEDVVLLQSFSRPDFSESQDPGYQQFLKAMDTGAAVDLMLANSPSAGFELSPTIPIIRPGKSATTKTSSGKSSPSESFGPRRTRRAGLITLAAVTVLTLFIAAFAVLRGNSGPGSQTANAKAQTGNTAPPTARLAAPEPLRLKAGDNLDVLPEFEDKPPESPKAGKLVWKTGKGTPDGVTIDPDSGRVQWKIPNAFAIASYSIPVELHFELNGKRTLVSSTALVVTLQVGTVEYKFGQSGPIQLEPGQTFNWKSDLIPAPELKMKYRLSGDKPPRHDFNEISGELALKPRQEDLGKFDISMELLNEDGSVVLAKVTRSVLVLPKNLAFTLPTIPEQRTRAGETLKVRLFPAPNEALRKLLTLKLIAPTGVVGAELDNASGTFTWTVPGNTRDSRFEFIVEAGSAIPELSLSGTAPLSTRISVTVGAAPAGSAAPATAQTPDPAAVEKAETALKEQYKKELSSTNRPKFVRRLLELQYEQPPGPDDFALLKLVIETDSKARTAADGILEALRIREERYGVSGLTETLQVASQFKVTPAAAQQDRIIELLLLAALDAASAQRWADVVTLLKLPGELTKRPRNNSEISGMADGLRQAESLANSLASGNGQADAVKQTDLLSLLRRWQFHRTFSGDADLRYIQSGNVADQLPDGGRSLWKFSATGLDVAGPQQKVAIGILEPASLPARWVHRMQVHGSTSGLAVLLGASGETQIPALLLTLDASAPGRVTPLSGGADLLTRNSSLNVPRDAWNDFEISVDGKALRVRMNGELLCQGTLAALNQGQLGLLRQPTDSPQPPVRIRQPRLLRLPDTP